MKRSIVAALACALLLPACASRIPVDAAAQVPPPNNPTAVKNKTEKQPLNQQGTQP